MLVFLASIVATRSIRYPSTYDLEPFQGAWQASVPIPIHVKYDVPQRIESSFAESSSPASFLQMLPSMHDRMMDNNFVLRLSGPEESAQTIEKEVDALKFQEQVKLKQAKSERDTKGKVFLDTVERTVKEMVHELMAPLRALPNPFV